MISRCLLVLGGLVGCQEAAPTSDLAQPVTGGIADDGDPAVVAIVLADDPTLLRCTGTVIAERVVLTAAHCDVHLDRASYAVAFGSDLGGAVTVIEILDAQAHPDFDDTETHDLALLLLAEPAPAVAVVPMADPPPVALRLVGFGVTGPDAADGGRKREGSTLVTEVAATHVVLGADPSLPCNGDSGGPALAITASGEELAAVISRGDPSCATYGKATRVDVHLASFLEPYLAATAAGVVELGDACLYPEHCASGLCLEALDEPLFRFCSQTCDDDAGCPDALACEAGECRYPQPSPGAVGAACSADADCLRGECLDDGWCSVRCVSGRGDCPDGYECTHLGDIDFYCTPAPQGGCGCGASTPGSGALLLLAMAGIAANTGRRCSSRCR